MLQNVKQVQGISLSYLKQTHFMGLMTYTRDQFAQFFTSENPAPPKIAAQLIRYITVYEALDDAYKRETYSLDTEAIKDADSTCDSVFMGFKKMVLAQVKFDFNPPVAQAARLVKQAIDKYDIDVSEDYLGENNKLHQLVNDLTTVSALISAVETLGLQSLVTQLAVKVAELRQLLTERGLQKPAKGEFNAARTAMEPEYRWLITGLNAYALVDENEHRFDTLIDTLNQNINYLKTVVLARQGGGSSGSEEANPNDIIPENGDNGSSTTDPSGSDDNGGETPPNGGDDNSGGETPPSGDDNNGGGETPPSGGDNNGGGGGGNPPVDQN